MQKNILFLILRRRGSQWSTVVQVGELEYLYGSEFDDAPVDRRAPLTVAVYPKLSARKYFSRALRVLIVRFFLFIYVFSALNITRSHLYCVRNKEQVAVMGALIRDVYQHDTCKRVKYFYTVYLFFFFLFFWIRFLSEYCTRVVLNQQSTEISVKSLFLHVVGWQSRVGPSHKDNNFENISWCQKPSNSLLTQWTASNK